MNFYKYKKKKSISIGIVFLVLLIVFIEVTILSFNKPIKTLNAGIIHENWGANGIVVSNATGYQGSPRIVTDNAGGIIILWTDQRSGFQVYGQRFNSSGVAQWTANGKSLSPASHGVNAILADGSGGVFFVSQSHAFHIDSSGNHLWNSNGVQLFTSAGSSCYNLASDGSGGIIATCTYINGANLEDLRIQRVSSAGTTQWGATGVNIGTTSGEDDGSSNIEIQPDGSGGAIIAWVSRTPCCSYTFDIRVQRVNSSGTAQWTANGIVLDLNSTYNSPEMKMVPDGTGNFFVGWASSKSTGGTPLLQKINLSGTLLFGANGKEMDPTVTFGFPFRLFEMKSDGNNGLIVSWGTFQRLDNNGNSVWKNSTNVPTYGTVSISNGRIFTAGHNSYPGGNGTWEAYISTYNLTNGEHQTSGFATSNVANDQTYARPLADGAGGMYVVWDDLRNNATTGNDIYIQRITTSQQITSVQSGYTVKRPNGDNLVSPSSFGETSSNIELTAQKADEYPHPSFKANVDMTADRSWVNFQYTAVDVDNFTYAQGIHALPGVINGEYTLYAVRDPEDDLVIICPGINYYGNMSEDCAGGQLLRPGDANLTATNIGGVDLWEISGLTQTVGVLSSIDYNFSITSQPTSVNANELFEIDVALLDGDLNPLTSDYPAGVIGISLIDLSDNSTVASGTYQLSDNGVLTFSIFSRTDGTKNYRVEYNNNSNKYDDADPITVTYTTESFTLSDYPSTVPVGSTFSFVLDALTSSNTTDTLYWGAPVASSTSTNWNAPAVFELKPYYLNPGIGFMVPKTYYATFNEVGSFTITMSDPDRPELTATTATIEVTPPVVADLDIYGADTNVVVAEDTPFTLHVAALGSDGFQFTNGYVGTVTFSSSLTSATLPGDYTFTVEDYGYKEFANAFVLDEPGLHTITITDISDSDLTDTIDVKVLTTETDHFDITPNPLTLQEGVGGAVTVTAKNSDNSTNQFYVGSVSFSSNNVDSTLPSDYTFVEADNGVASGLNLSMQNVGSYTLTVTDTVNSSIVGSAVVNVIPSPGVKLDDLSKFDYRIDGDGEDFCLSCWDNVIAVGDVNGDNIDDIIMHGYENGGNDDIIYVVFGGDDTREQITTLTDSSSYNIRIEPNLVDYSFYLYGTMVRDVNNDGKGDLILVSGDASYTNSNGGSVVVMYSTLLDDYSGTGNVMSLDNPSSFNFRIDGNTDDGLGARDGWPVFKDYNSDNVSDFIIPGYSNTIYFIDSSTFLGFGTSTGNIIDLSQSTSYDFKVANSNNPSGFGTSTGVTNKIVVDDVTGDSNIDLVVGDPYADNYYGSVYFIDSSIFNSWFGTGSTYDVAQSTNYSAVFRDSAPSQSYYLSTVFAGDVNSDNKKDLLMDFNYGSGTGTYLFFSSLLSTISGTGNDIDLANNSFFNLRLEADSNRTRVGPVSVGTDWNNDGNTDLVLNSVNDSYGGYTGVIYVLYSTLIQSIGTSTGNIWDLSDSNYNIVITPGTNNEGLNINASYNPIDWNNDGEPDLMIGADSAGYNGEYSGSIYIISSTKLASLGSLPTELALSNSDNFITRFDGPGPDAEFNDWGQNLQGDFNGDNLNDLIFGNYNTSFSGDYSGSVYIVLGEAYIPEEPEGYNITNLINPLTTRLQSDNTIDLSVTKRIGQQNARLFRSAMPVADIEVSLTQDRNWNNVNAGADIGQKKAFVHNLTSAPGAAPVYSLYVPKAVEDNRVYICPNATSLNDVALNCSGGYEKSASDSGISIVTYLSNQYWKVDNLTGTGGLSYLLSQNNGGNDNGGGNTGGNNNGGGTQNPPTNSGGGTTQTPQPIAPTQPTPTDPDTDNDGLTDSEELQNGTNPNDSDSDNDGLLDGEEVDGCIYNPGTTTCSSTTFTPTNPNDSDSDNDGLADGEEVNGCIYTVGTTTCSNTTTSPTNPNDSDSDNDGLLDGEEVEGCIYLPNSTECSSTTFTPTNPNNGTSYYIPPSGDPEDLGSGETVTPVSENSPGLLDGTIGGVINSVVTSIVSGVSNTVSTIVTAPLVAVEVGAKSGTLPTALVVTTTSAVTLSAVTYPNVVSYAFLWFKKKKKYNPWGVVFDSLTNKPIAFATVRLSSLSGGFIAQAVTDLNGKYSINTAPGIYMLNVKIGNYQEYSQQIETKADVLNVDIPLTSINKSGINLRRFIKNNLSLVNSIVFYGGFIFSVLTVIYAPSLINIVVLLIFLVQSIIYYKVKSAKSGVVYDSINKNKLKGIFVKVYEESGRQLGSAITDNNGKYNLVLPKGKYYIKLESLQYKMQDGFAQLKDALGTPYIVVEMAKEDLLNVSIPMQKKLPSEINSNVKTKFGFMS